MWDDIRAQSNALMFRVQWTSLDLALELSTSGIKERITAAATRVSMFVVLGLSLPLSDGYGRFGRLQ
jgi:hypothetical protein